MRLSFIPIQLLIAILLTACTPWLPERGAPDLSTPDAAHRAWLDALQRGDREAALALYDPQATFRGEYVTQAIAYAQEQMHPSDYWYGEFDRVEALPAAVSGMQAKATSVWYHKVRPGDVAAHASCASVTLAKIASTGAWSVVSWDDDRCPRAIAPEG